MLGGPSFPRDHQNAIALIRVGGDRGPYCEVVETKQSDRLGVPEGALKQTADL